jgi:methyl-accepting chemotaxis protein
VHSVKKARKPQGRCGSCGKDIEVGQGYRYIAPRYGPKKKRHLSCPAFKPSELTSNDKMAALLAALEDGEEELGAWTPAEDEPNLDDLQGILQNIAEHIREAAEMWTESAENIEQGFGHATWQSEEFEETASEVESFADEVENWSLPDPPEKGEDTETPYDEQVATWADEARDAALEALQNCPV